MLISFSKRFIFIANTKAASTTIEKLLRRDSQIVLTRAWGKHVSYAGILKHFAFIFEKSGVAADSYFRFGVIREPLEWVVSWYNYRQREKVAASPASCKGMSFDDFAREVMSQGKRRPFARIGSQSASFKDPGGGLGVDYLIPLPRVDSELPTICAALGLKIPRNPKNVKHNASPRIIGVQDISPETANELRRHFAEDAALFRKAEEGGFGDVSDIIRGKLG